MPIDNVNAGDIITSDLMNRVIETLNQLEEDVANLGNLNNVRIEQILPESGGRVGQFITIEGANFVVPPGENIVRIGSRLVEEFASPNTSRVLTVRIPPTLNVTDPQGTELEVSISNDFGSARSSYIVLPESTQPPVVVDTITGDGPQNLLQSEGQARFNGSGFAQPPSGNQIEFSLVRPGGGTSRFPVDPDDIDPGSTSDQIDFVMPEITGISTTIPTSMTLSVTVDEQRFINNDVPGLG